MKARLVKFGEVEVEGKRYTHDVVIDGGKVRTHAAFGRGRNSLGRQAAHCRDRRPWRASGNGRSPSGSEAARYGGHFGAHIGSLRAARGSEEGPSVRYPALHVLTGIWEEKSHHSLNSPAYSCVSITLPASNTEGPRFSFWARPSLFRPPFFKSYVRRGASMIAPSLPIASTGQPSIASLQSASSSGVSGCL